MEDGHGPCVVRVAKEAILTDADLSKIKKRELDVASTLRSSNYFVKLLKHFVVDRMFVTVWEFAEGGSLRDIVNVETPLEREVVYNLLKSVAKGLDKLHAIPGAHGDIKPDNLLVFDDELSKLAILELQEYFVRQPNSKPRCTRMNIRFQAFTMCPRSLVISTSN